VFVVRCCARPRSATHYCALSCSALLCCALSDACSSGMRCVVCSALLFRLNCALRALSLQFCCVAVMLCAVCMQLDAGRALLCAAVLPVCSCALVCSAACVALLCCALCCMAVLCRAVLCVRVCCLPVCVAALCELLVRRAWREALLCAALPCCAVFCFAVHWNGREFIEK
jgi:hypothetical protein